MVAKLAVSIAKFQAWNAMTSIAWVSHKKRPNKKTEAKLIFQKPLQNISGPKGLFFYNNENGNLYAFIKLQLNTRITVFENHPKCHIKVSAFSTIFVQSKSW